ncbi:MFS transporter [Pseudomonas rhizoryzae]|uniref:MFS transporter n=1 Tax=Pseudomonas rhizoryzae TaxID=2571129 RepID=UPI0010C1E30D|nr:MFS transporter [Pseudomonas rhizoryzae]
MTPLPSDRAIWQLGLMQLLAWGLAFYLPGVYGPAMAAGLGWDARWVYGGFSLAMLTMGLVSPFSGAVIERLGGCRTLQLGLVLDALGCLGLAAAHSAPFFYLAWVILGVGMRLSLYDAAFATLARLAGDRSRAVMVRITLLGGLASAVFWPLGHWLLELLGWRLGLVVYAAIALVGLLLLLPLPNVRGRLPSSELPTLTGGASPRLAGVLFATGMALIGFLSAGLSAHLPALLAERGVPVEVAALWGIGQVCARLAELASGQRLSARQLNLLLGLGLPLSFALALASEGHLLLTAGFVFLYGALNGLVAVLRASLPLELFDRALYARLTGKLLAPSFLLSAAAPWCYALAREHWGDRGLLGLCLLVSLGVTLAAVGLLGQRHARVAS